MWRRGWEKYSLFHLGCPLQCLPDIGTHRLFWLLLVRFSKVLVYYVDKYINVPILTFLSNIVTNIRWQCKMFGFGIGGVVGEGEKTGVNKFPGKM